MLIMHDNWNTILRKTWQTEFWFARFLMFLSDIRVWIDSKDLKECNGHLQIGRGLLELGLQFTCLSRFSWTWNRVSRAIFLFFLDRCASCIYTGCIWDGYWQESINIQCKSNLIFVQNQIFKIWLISNPILPYWSNFEICWPLWVSWISRKE